MRIIDPIESEQRKKRLLQIVIHHYIKTAKPVGSSIIAESYKMNLSSATIRHILSELENEGFLTHPHTSAGRVPTDKGYRAYVDSLMEVQRLAIEEEQRIRAEYEAKIREIESLLFSTSRTLSVLSHYTGFALTPRMEEDRLRHMELVPMDNSNNILTVMIAESGVIKHKIAMLKREIPSHWIRFISGLINDSMRGSTFGEIRAGISDELDRALGKEKELAVAIKDMLSQIFEVAQESELFLDGARNMLTLPDFYEYEQMMPLVQLIDQRKLLTNILYEDMSSSGFIEHGGVSVKIGSENTHPELKNLSLITSAYKMKDKTMGILGIIGPKRMEYSRMISLVSYVSKMVNKIFGKFSGG